MSFYAAKVEEGVPADNAQHFHNPQPDSSWYFSAS